MTKINIAELLKDCPQGIELDCTMFDNVTFVGVDNNRKQYPIEIKIGGLHSKYLTKEGCFHDTTLLPESKCVIFPKGKTTWEGFVPPCQFKDGDVISNLLGTCIFKGEGRIKGTVDYYCGVVHPNYFNVKDKKFNPDKHYGNIVDYRFATEEEKQKLFDAIKANGYKWNTETNTLEKLIEPKFHVGDWVTDGVSKCQICFINDTQYWYAENCILGSIETVDKQYHLWNINDAKDGDVLYSLDSKRPFIFKHRKTNEQAEVYCGINIYDKFFVGNTKDCIITTDKYIPATKEQHDFLFSKMKEAGYKWNEETKTLEKLIEPKFKVGDRIKDKNNFTYTVLSAERWGYMLDDIYRTCVAFGDQDNYELVPNKFDISTLVPFKSEVLVRNSNSGFWKPAFWGIYEAEKTNEHQYRNYLTTEGFVRHCIPYNDETKHLLGKTDDCDKFYKTWEE